MSPDKFIIEGLAIRAYERDCAGWGSMSLPTWESLPFWKKAQWYRVALIDYNQARGIKCG